MRRRVLVVDDDPSVAIALAAPLRAAGLEVESVLDGSTAFHTLTDGEYAAVILDPRIRQTLNGYAVLGYIECERPRLLPHVFLLTGLSRQTISLTAPALLPRFFRKPADLAALAAAVAEASGQCARS